MGLLGIFLWKYLVPYGYLTVQYFRSRKQQYGMKKANIQRFSEKHLSRLVVALAEFQKAQCFFMLATNVAALVVLGTLGGLNPASLQQLYNTYTFMKLVAVSGYLPVTFTLFILHLVDMQSWYLLLLSSLTVALSLSTLLVTGSFNPSQKNLDHLEELASAHGPESCSRRQPGIYCFYGAGPRRLKSQSYGSDDLIRIHPSGNISDQAFSIFAFCLAVLIFLVVYKAKKQQLPIVERLFRRVLWGVSVSSNGVIKLSRRALQASSVRQVTSRISQKIAADWKGLSRKLDLYCTSSRFPRIYSWFTVLKANLEELDNARISVAFVKLGVLLSHKVDDWLKRIGYREVARRVFLFSVYLIFFSWFLKFFTLFVYALASVAIEGLIAGTGTLAKSLPSPSGLSQSLNTSTSKSVSACPLEPEFGAD